MFDRLKKIRKLKTNIGLCLCIFLAVSCSSSRKAYNPQYKYPPAELQADYSLFRSILESSHPSIYWYTTKDSMDYFFEKGSQSLHDSLTEIQFRDVLAYVISKLDCGRTSIKGSKAFNRYIDTASSWHFHLP
jgi:hypothetical protein